MIPESRSLPRIVSELPLAFGNRSDECEPADGTSASDRLPEPAPEQLRAWGRSVPRGGTPTSLVGQRLQQMLGIPPDLLHRVGRQVEQESHHVYVALTRAGRSMFNRPSLPQSAVPNDQAYLSLAVRRWGASYGKEEALAFAKVFCESLMPLELLERLEADPASQGLLTLCAGMAFTSEVTNVDNNFVPGRCERALTADLRFLHAHPKDAILLKSCQQVADDSIGHCDDRVSYGVTQLHHVVERHRLQTGCVSAKQLFEGMERQFNQSVVEANAHLIATVQRQQRESVGVYHNLVLRVRAHGKPLLEEANVSSHGAKFPVSEEDVERTLISIDTKNTNPAYLDSFKGHLAAEHVLRQLFSEEFALFMDKRTVEEGAQADIMLDPGKTTAQRSHASSHLKELGQLEGQWYRERLQEVLANPRMLGNI